MEDAEIRRLLEVRSEEALRGLSEEYGALAESIAHRIVGDRRDAQECVSDACLAVWNTVPPAVPRSMKAYFCTLARRAAIKRLRYNTAHKREGAVSFPELAFLPDRAGSAGDGARLGALIGRWLSRQPRRGRLLFMKRYYMGESIAELAGFFGISENNVSVRLSRLRDSLRRELEKEGVEI
jgi:RNA polymerase sigma-70 factor (ECF subfamily)